MMVDGIIGQSAGAAFVLLLLGAFVWAARSRRFIGLGLRARNVPAALEVVHRVHLSAAQQLCLVKYRGREILLALSGSSCTVLEREDKQ